MRSIELIHSQIRLSPHNVRIKLHEKAQLEELAASILSRGLRTPIEVHPMRGHREKPIYGAFAGGGRYRAIGLLIERGDVPPDWPIRAELYDELSDGQVVLASLVENDMRYSLRDFETYKGVVKAHKLGQSVAEIAQALGGRNEHEILQWLRIGELAPPIFDAFGAGRLSLDQARAYGATDDHKLQLAAYEALKNAVLCRPSDIRAWMKFNDPVAERELLYVGERAYLAAGGTLQSDLFAEAGERRRLIVQPQLLRQLVEAKLAALKDDLRRRVDRDVRFVAKPPQNDFNTADHFLLAETREGDGDAIVLPDGDIVGCVVIDEAGRADVSWWWSSRAAKFGEGRTGRADRVTAAAKPSPKPETALPPPNPATDAAAIDQGTTEIMRSQRRAILRAALIDDAIAGGRTARDYWVFGQLRLLVHPGSHQRTVGMPRLLLETGPESARPFLEGLPATHTWSRAIAELSRRPMLSLDNEADAWLAFLEETDEIRNIAAAIVTGLALDRSLASADYTNPVHDLIATRVGLANDAAIRQYWEPTEKLLDKLPLAQRLAIAAPFVGAEAMAVWKTARASDVTRRLLALVTGAASWATAQASAAAATWVHPLLRFAGPDDPEDPGVNDVAAAMEEAA